MEQLRHLHGLQRERGLGVGVQQGGNSMAQKLAVRILPHVQQRLEHSGGAEYDLEILLQVDSYKGFANMSVDLQLRWPLRDVCGPVPIS